jgi:hypothetical protein
VKTAILLPLKLALLTLILFVCFSVGSAVAGLSDSSRVADPAASTAALLAVCFLDTLALSYPILRSRWAGWPLVVSLALLFFGVMSFLSQIETVVFLEQLVSRVSPDLVPRVLVQGAVVAALFSPLAVLVHGRMRGAKEPPQPNSRLVMPWSEWAWKLLTVAVAYLLIYLSFGLFVATPLGGAAFQQYYAGLQMPWWMLPFQMGRAMIWTVLALPVIRMMKGSTWEAGLAVALLYSLLMGDLLLLPNPVMPDPVRIAHLVELLTSNFLFGWVVVWLLHRHHTSWRDLLGLSTAKGLVTAQ